MSERWQVDVREGERGVVLVTSEPPAGMSEKAA